MKKTKLKTLVECAVMAALSFVLSLIKVGSLGTVEAFILSATGAIAESFVLSVISAC